MEAASSSPAEDVEALRAELAGAKAEAARGKAINTDMEAARRSSSSKMKRCGVPCMANGPSEHAS
jgi:hypothetical protein